MTDADGDTDELTFTIVVVADNMPSFQGLVGDQSYVENQAITPVALPEAVGGDAPLVYSLSRRRRRGSRSLLRLGSCRGLRLHRLRGVTPTR